MKGDKKIRTLVGLTFVFMFVIAIAPQCYAEKSSDETSIEEVKQKTKELLDTLKSYTAEQRDEAMQKTKSALDNMDKRIDALETQVYNNWDKMDKAARQKSQDSLQALRKKRTQVAEWYGSLKNSSADAWGRMKNGFSEAYTALHDAWEKSEEEIGSEE